MTTDMRIARYYRGARTAHLERLHRSVRGDFLYMKPMYDFDVSQAPAGQPVRQVGLFHVLAAIWRGRYDVLEIVEPYAPSALPQNVAIALTVRLARFARRPRVELVAYAIENADLVEKYASQYRLPVGLVRWLLRTAVGICYFTLSRIAFGTAAAEENYRELLGERSWSRDRPDRTVIPGISSPRRGAADGEIPDERRLVFLGAFDERKGVRQLLEAWPLVGDLVPDPELLLLGKGPLLDWVRDRAGSLRGVSLVIDPQREEIWSALSESRVLYLLSQPAPGWKEQIGLPIVEGLSVGLEVIASSETGIADWLTQNGHRVLGPDASAEAIAHAVAEALQTTRPRAEIVATLPNVDGRLVADRWLHREPSE